MPIKPLRTRLEIFILKKTTAKSRMSIFKPLTYIHNYYFSPGFGNNKYKLPTHVNFPITDNCNSKCRMCNVWKDKSENELSAEEIKTIYSNKLFKKVKHLGISGGEPTLRKDLLDCVSAILTALPKLQSLSITSHGFHPTKWKRFLPEIKQLCEKSNTFFKLNISVDGIEDLHNEVRRVENGWEKVIKTIQIAKSLGVPLQIQCTVSKHNVYGINEVLHFAKKNNIELIFRKATSINRLYNSNITNEFYTSTPEDSFFSDFLKSKTLKTNTSNPGRLLFYKELSDRIIKGTKRKAPCHFQYNGVLISAHGEMFHCSIDQKALGDCRANDPYSIYFSKNSINQLKELTTNICPNCLHDQSGAWTPFKLIKNSIISKSSKIKSLEQLMLFAFKNLKLIFGLYKRRVKIATTSTKQNIHIIGAYGGEHVGDSAILGGVVLRLLDRYKHSNNITVYSKRPDRTAFWIKGLDFKQDVELVVKDYNELNKINCNTNDALIWAGGPIMEMPQDLFEHYVTIKSFCKQNLKFEIIGCGWGPFKTKYSLKLANKIATLSSYTEMRDDYQLPIPYVKKQDPAFDYLHHQKQVELSEKWSWTQSKIDEFIKKINPNKTNKLILLNLRPTWSKYNKTKISTNKIDNMVINNILDVIKNFPKEYKVVSVPFNTDHYGFSDMIPALRLKDLCDENGLKNYFVFNRELNARDKIYLLKHFDYGICMRFHACIFLKSQTIPVFGLDYTAGETGKVGGLFKQFNNSNWFNIMSFDTNKLIGFFNENNN